MVSATATPKWIVDRVSSINPDGSVFEVHSVGFHTRPYIYARWLVELDRKRSKSDNSYLIDLKKTAIALP